MQRTRRQILDYIKLNGGMRIDQLSEVLQVAPITVRAHVNVLERDQLLKGQEHRTGRAGRPGILYYLTEQAQELFPKYYDHLASSLISNVRKLYGEQSVNLVLKRVGEEMALASSDEIQAEDMGNRIGEAAKIMNKMGSFATWGKEGDKYILTAHNCPYLHVAKECSEICDMEVSFLKKALSTHVELECSVVGGAHNCRFFIEGE